MSDNILIQAARYEKYPEVTENVYAPKWYYSKEITLDEYSAKLYHSKKENKTSYFGPYLRDLINALEKFKLVNFQDVDLVTIIPSHEPGKFSVTLERLGSFLAMLIDSKFEEILERIKNTQPTGTRSHDAIDRYNNVTGSLTLTRPLNEKKIVIFDDIKTSGIHILETKKVLAAAGVKETISICLGINSSIVMDIETMVEKDEEGKIWITTI